MKQAYLVETLRNGSVDHQMCIRQWQTIFGHDVSSACARLLLGYQHVWQGAVKIYRKAHGWIREAMVTDNFWCDSDFMLSDWREESIERSADVSGDEQCEMTGLRWKWLPNKLTNCTQIRDNFQAYEYMKRRNYPEQATEFLREREVWHCYPQCEND
ncbi:hypothetical protein Q1695_013583 [Nippostrongylus brasiliensis]|nr:hypothetical protein Q1695_013583 [Nippostrongylus brasiliensis]